ncbi:MAG: hypothetical protein ACR2PF_17185, partial [Rhizobiaceae bacterium]
NCARPDKTRRWGEPMATHIIKTTDFIEAEEIVDESGFKIAKTAILYAAVSMILALVLVPWNNFNTQKMASAISSDTITGGVDQTITGSIQNTGNKRTRIRRSVLQADPRKPCFILANGRTEGDC